MISYRVDWEPKAEQDLTLIWLQTFDPAVTSAQARIDDLLARNPTGHGRYLSEGLYQIRITPLAAFSITSTKRRKSSKSRRSGTLPKGRWRSYFDVRGYPLSRQSRMPPSMERTLVYPIRCKFSAARAERNPPPQ